MTQKMIIVKNNNRFSGLMGNSFQRENFVFLYGEVAGKMGSFLIACYIFSGKIIFGERFERSISFFRNLKIVYNIKSYIVLKFKFFLGGRSERGGLLFIRDKVGRIKELFITVFLYGKNAGKTVSFLVKNCMIIIINIHEERFERSISFFRKLKMLYSIKSFVIMNLNDFLGERSERSGSLSLRDKTKGVKELFIIAFLYGKNADKIVSFLVKAYMIIIITIFGECFERSISFFKKLKMLYGIKSFVIMGLNDFLGERSERSGSLSLGDKIKGIKEFFFIIIFFYGSTASKGWYLPFLIKKGLWK